MLSIAFVVPSLRHHSLSYKCCRPVGWSVVITCIDFLGCFNIYHANWIHFTHRLQKFKLLTANTVISSENAAMETMGTDQLLDLFNLSSNNASQQQQQASTSGIKSVLETLPDLWDDKQYEEEYDMTNFIKGLNKMTTWIPNCHHIYRRSKSYIQWTFDLITSKYDVIQFIYCEFVRRMFEWSVSIGWLSPVLCVDVEKTFIQLCLVIFNVRIVYDFGKAKLFL